MVMCAMPADPASPLGNPDSPTMISRINSAALVLCSILIVFGFSILTGRDMALPEKLNAAVIILGVLAGLFHLFGAVPQGRHMRAFASPIAAWPVMIAGIATLITS
jgi:hypothetical protein